MNTKEILTKSSNLIEDMTDLCTRANSLHFALQQIAGEYKSLEKSYLETVEALRLAQRQVLIHELAAKGQGLDDNDIPYDLPKAPEAEVLTKYGAPGIVVSLAFLERMYNALPMLQQLPQRCYGGTLGDEYRALIANKGY